MAKELGQGRRGKAAETLWLTKWWPGRNGCGPPRESVALY